MTTTPKPPFLSNRRAFLKGTLALATSSVEWARSPIAAAADSVAPGNDGAEHIDRVLRAPVEAGRIPGVVALAATREGIIYQGAFGKRHKDTGPAMSLDTVFRIASMTKAITSVAAMQLVEQGKLTLDGPLPDVDPALNDPQVLEGFDVGGAPILRPAKRAITLRHLLTHTAGFSYEIWNGNTMRYVQAKGLPSIGSGKAAALRIPLSFDPGDRWQYGMSTDWVGRVVERVSGQPLDLYFREHILDPLEMHDTTYRVTAEMRQRQAHVHQRDANGLVPQPLETPFVPEIWVGGGGLYSTGPDYLKFLRMLLAEGEQGGWRVLAAESVRAMARNHVGDIPCGVLKAAMPARSNDVDFFPGASLRWGLGYMINVDAVPNGRSAGSVCWGGLFNTYYWIDAARGVTALIMTQVLPFADPEVLATYGKFESAVYQHLSLKAAQERGAPRT